MKLYREFRTQEEIDEQYDLDLGVIVGIFLKETAPRRKQVSEPAGAPV